MFLKDIIDILDLKTDELGQFFSKNKVTVRSITRSTKDLTMVFPVMTSSTLSSEAGTLVARALERKFVTLTQMVLSAISITNSEDAIDHLKYIHSNLNLDDFFSVDDYITLAKESTSVIKPIEYSDVKFVHEDWKSNQRKSLPLTRVQVLKEYQGKSAADAFYKHEERMKRIDLDIEDNRTKRARIRADFHQSNLKHKEELERNKTKIELQRLRNEEAEKNRMHILHRDSLKRMQAEKDRDNAEINKYLSNHNPKVQAQDYKKANELQPQILQIEFISKVGERPINTSAYIGIKSKIYPVDSMDIINHIISKRSYSFSLYNLIKATSGEIEFWRDFVFALKKAKIDALSNSKRGSSSKLWKVLERRALSSKINRYLGMRNDATAITSLVLSSIDIEYLKKEEDLDLSNSAVARKILDEYNLISIVIVDESLESAKFIFDTGDDEYEPYTFKTLKREDKIDYKQMIQLLAGGH